MTIFITQEQYTVLIRTLASYECDHEPCEDPCSGFFDALNANTDLELKAERLQKRVKELEREVEELVTEKVQLQTRLKVAELTINTLREDGGGPATAYRELGLETLQADCAKIVERIKEMQFGG